MKVVIDFITYTTSLDRYLHEIIKSHDVISSKITFDNINEFLHKSNDKRKINLYISLLQQDIDFQEVKGDINGTCGYMDNYTTTLATETNSDYIIYFKNRCFDRMETDKTEPKTIKIYDFIRKFC